MKVFGESGITIIPVKVIKVRNLGDYTLYSAGLLRYKSSLSQHEQLIGKQHQSIYTIHTLTHILKAKKKLFRMLSNRCILHHSIGIYHVIPYWFILSPFSSIKETVRTYTQALFKVPSYTGVTFTFTHIRTQPFSGF